MALCKLEPQWFRDQYHPVSLSTNVPAGGLIAANQGSSRLVNGQYFVKCSFTLGQAGTSS